MANRMYPRLGEPGYWLPWNEEARDSARRAWDAAHAAHDAANKKTVQRSNCAWNYLKHTGAV